MFEKVLAAFALGITLLIATPSPATAQDFSLRVVTDDRHDWNKRASLTVIAEPGSQDYREVILTNSTNKTMRLNLDIANSKSTDGQISIDDESEAFSNKYISFSENPAIIAPGGVKAVRITVKTPQGINPFTETPYLLLSTEAKVPKRIDDGKIRAYLPIVNRVAYPIFVGVGNYADFKTDFSIDKVEFFKGDEGNAARLWIKNNGRLDLPIEGFIKFQDAAFAGQVLGPFTFENATILPKSTAFVVINLPPEIIESKWRVFTQVESNDIIKTRIFIENISFSAFSLANLSILGLIFIFSLVALGWSLRQFRRQGSKPLAVEIPVLKPEEAVAKKAVAKKAVAKKAVAKKAVAKKAVAKKPVAKKPVARA